MIKAVILDCFGVLTSDGWLPFKDKYFKSDPALFQEATRLNTLANSDLLSYQEFVSKIAAMAKVSHDEVMRLTTGSVANDELLKYVKASLKSKYKIGMLSNASQDVLRKLFSEEQIGLFDEIALSYETGVPKPDQRAYLGLAQNLKVQADECVFIDDQQKHIEGAQKAGMRAIQYQNFNQMKRELEAILAAGPDN